MTVSFETMLTGQDRSDPAQDGACNVFNHQDDATAGG